MPSSVGLLEAGDDPLPRVLVSIAVHPLTVARLRAPVGRQRRADRPTRGRLGTCPASHAARPRPHPLQAPARATSTPVTDLKMIQIGTVGYEHPQARTTSPSATVRLCNARGLFDTAIAEWKRRHDVRAGRATCAACCVNQDHGVWGPTDALRLGAARQGGRHMGLRAAIGRETARLAKTLGMAVHVPRCATGVKARAATTFLPAERRRPPAASCPTTSSTAGQGTRLFWAAWDFLIVAMPLTQRSTGMIGEMEFRAMPRTSFLLKPVARADRQGGGAAGRRSV